MILRPLVAIALTALTLAAPGAAMAQAVGAAAAPAGGLTFQQARAKFPRLTQVTFDHADLNGDGVIEPQEMPVLQSMYDQTYQNR
jgi:hypothetical protein